MKEDILEQVAEDWLIAQPRWFVKHNVRYRPAKGCEGYISKHDSVNSDIDILGVHGTKTGQDRVAVVTCKSWQNGFDPAYWTKVIEGEAEVVPRHSTPNFMPKEKWKYIRELVSAKWIDAFLCTLERETGQRDFTYYIAVTKLLKNAANRDSLENSAIVRERFEMRGSTMKLKVITLEEMMADSWKRFETKETSALESTDAGRFLQLMNAAGLKPMPADSQVKPKPKASLP